MQHMRKGIILLLILLFPSIVYLLFSLGEHNVERMGFYGEVSINASGDSVYKSVPELYLRASDSTRFSLNELKGKPLIIDFLPWPCDEPCMKKGVTLVNFLNEVGMNDQWSVLSIVMDDGITGSQLIELRNKHLPEMENWSFVAAVDSMQLSHWVDYAFLKIGRISNINQMPANEVVLLDQQGRIREYFDLRIHKQSSKMEDAIKLLLQEPHIEWKD